MPYFLINDEGGHAGKQNQCVTVLLHMGLGLEHRCSQVLCRALAPAGELGWLHCSVLGVDPGLPARKHLLQGAPWRCGLKLNLSLKYEKLGNIYMKNLSSLGRASSC